MAEYKTLHVIEVNKLLKDITKTPPENICDVIRLILEQPQYDHIISTGECVEE